MNLVFHALFVLKVGVCFLTSAKFSECLWLVLVGDKMQHFVSTIRTWHKFILKGVFGLP